MSVATRVLKKIQEARLMMKTKVTKDSMYVEGFVDGLEMAEDMICDEQKNMHVKIVHGKNELWKTGNPSADDTGDYILIIKANFTGDGIVKDNIYISADYWNGYQFENLILGDGEWTVLYFARLRDLHFPIPVDLNIKKTPEMFLD